mmetsp:Transcript_6939/g.9010  ORF Transcript_6939/g.9010 Transcript_6939/m.9010 type:complete len:177 (+) Transcript_6939:223-753(+)|eukprot:CAMPEP_0198138530 /NCGR_PEP_ID=MMETSP1443-20131203/1915_1 /TAXON_ID=186043 /ORGANISM="Entomoneis sp., Strain CCMP2396" /LENGTH=176 /DNA_ID=CAMNT_0043800329 /DNA_START=215 /DNA_END=745 /DNA_ORIENTATION=-
MSGAGASFKKLPPHVQRELLKHVGGSATASSSTAGHNTAVKMLKEGRRGRMNRTLIGTIAFVGFTGSFPLLAWAWISNLSGREEPLTAAQNRRGAFNNSGSRDVGRDPDWDQENHRHKYEKGYGEITPERLPEAGSGALTRMERLLMPMDPRAMKRNDEATLTAAAKGLPPQESRR